VNFRFVCNLNKFGEISIERRMGGLNLPTKHIVREDRASGNSISAGSTSGLSHESLMMIKEVLKFKTNIAFVNFFRQSNRDNLLNSVT
jgi:hypothetical protein